ncbi:hypothetical protein L3X38_036771 [Prunus dulcis]|uniref:Reverse transcriptase domain-containing protein n=1 Tax=Prunus dulcis TaxID=3755 RepID=A0AAD4YQ23_PRUDU|nr:hypothetical protein L3X38_036771 [Prunus dulcis]
MNATFHDTIGRNLEVYIDDVVIKSESRPGHLDDLRSAFERMRQHQLKMNPKKCAFGVSAGNFLGFLVHQRGIEIDKSKAKAIINVPPAKKRKAEYEALIIGLEILKELGVKSVAVMGDSMLVLKQLSGDYKANAMAQLASGVEISEGLSEELFKVEKQSLPSVFERGILAEVMVLTIAPED